MLAGECLKNAKQHLRAANLLAEAGQHGFAYSHLVLCEEELGKGFAWRLVADDWAKIEGEGRGRRIIILPGTLDLTFQFSSHLEKGALKVGMVELLMFVSDTVIRLGFEVGTGKWKPASGQPAIQTPSLSPQQQDAMMQEIRKALTEWKEKTKDARKAEDEFKQFGFYVDLFEGGFITPDSIGPEIYEERRTLVDKELTRSAPFVREPIHNVLFAQFLLPMMIGAFFTSTPRTGTVVTALPPAKGAQPVLPQKRKWWRRLFG
jgi:hypothetical protein